MREVPRLAHRLHETSAESSMPKDDAENVRHLPH